MSARRNILRIGLAASLVLPGIAAAQTRLALTSPNVGPDPMDNSVPSFSRPLDSDMAPAAVSPRRLSPAAAPLEPRGNPLWAIPLKDFVFTRDRPLFTPSRRPATAPVAFVAPAKPVVVMKPPEPELPKLTLIGVILGEKDGIGIFVDSATREVVRLRKNQGHGGWILRTLQGRQATLEKAASTAVLVVPPPGGEPVPAVLLSGSDQPRPNGPEPQL